MTRTIGIAAFISLLSFASMAQAADWNQWRGPGRDGVAAQGPPLLSALPATGVKPVWLVSDDIAAARDGGWSSPVVADGRVYLFTHKRTKLIQGNLPARKFPWLPPNKRVGMTDKEYQEYEVKRRNEDEARAKRYRFDEIVHCFDAKSGKTLWKNQRDSFYSRFPQSGSPAVVDGRLYIMGADRTAHCIDAVSGKDIWKARLPGEFRDEFRQSSFAVADGVAVVLIDRLFGLDTKSGKLLWQGKEEDETGLHTSPVIWNHNGQSYALANIAGGNTICVNVKSGRELWRAETEGGHATPIVVGDRLLTYGSSRKRGLRCFQLSIDGAEMLWKYQKAADKGSSPVVVGDYVYVQGERRLACVDLATGKGAWMTMLDLNRPQYTSLVAADGKVIYALDGFLCFKATADDFQVLYNAKIDTAGLLAEEKTFRKLLDIDRLEKTAEGQKQADRIWRDRIGNNGPLACATPAIADGRVYMRIKKGLVCYDLSAEK